MSRIALHAPDELDAHLGSDLVIVGFFGSFSALAEQARPAFEAFADAHPETPVLTVDVGQVKGLHSRYGVTTVPSAVTLRDGQVIRRATGLHDAAGWARALLPHEAAPVGVAAAEAPRQKPVTVYTSPTCSWCTRIKHYFDEQGVRYREVDVSKDPNAAQELVRRSGQMGVPQTDIGGQIVVGFDKARIDSLLGLRAA